ncbi:MAG: TIGR02301 family protein [Methylovirgula sp.]
MICDLLLRFARSLTIAAIIGAFGVAPLAQSRAATAAPASVAPTAKKPAGPPAPPGVLGPPAPQPGDAAPPYEPQLLRLSELLGALAYLQDLCDQHQGDIWRVKMAALLDAEAKTPVRKERLAGAFNRGFQGYALTYRLCTPNAQAIISRFLEESGKIAHDVARQYGPS